MKIIFKNYELFLFWVYNTYEGQIAPSLKKIVKQMVENTETMVVAKAPTKEIQLETINLFSFMNPTTSEYFIADLYSSVLEFEDESDGQITELMVVLIRAIAQLNGNTGIDDSLERIMSILKEVYQRNITEIDKMTLLLIADEGKWETLNYYRTNARQRII